MNTHPATPSDDPTGFDYSFVETVGNIAIYDDLLSGPRVVKVQPADTATYIESLASGIYEYAREAGGSIPYTVIREVSENFIHAQFKEVLVTIRDRGNTISFADHGPGIPSKEKAQMPGFSSAVEPMRNYIRGVGSGLPIVREYLESSHGTITIEDNLGTGAVVTISLAQAEDDFEEPFDEDALRAQALAAPLSPAAQPMAGAGVPVPSTAVPAADGFTLAGQPVGAAQPAPDVPSMAAHQGTAVANPYGYNAIPADYGMPNPYGASPAPVPTAAPYPNPAPGYGYAPQPYGVPQPYGAATPYPAVSGTPYGATTADPYGRMPAMPTPALSEKEQLYLKMLSSEGPLGPTEMAKLTDGKPNTVFYAFERLEQAGLVQKLGKQRSLTPLGHQIVQGLL